VPVTGGTEAGCLPFGLQKPGYILTKFGIGSAGYLEIILLTGGREPDQFVEQLAGAAMFLGCHGWELNE
jgi:hypothetical protein